MFLTIHDDYLVCVINRRFPFVNVAEVAFEGIWLENGFMSFYKHFIGHQYMDIGHHHIGAKKKHTSTYKSRISFVANKFGSS